MRRLALPLALVPVLVAGCGKQHRQVSTSGTLASLREVKPDLQEATVEQGLDEVEASAFKSAVYGDERPIFHQGVCVGTVVEYSDAMRTLLLKGRRRSVFGDKVDVDHGAKVGLRLEEFATRYREAKE